MNVVRKRPNIDELVAELKSLGADEVFTEEQMLKEIKGKVKLQFFFRSYQYNGLSQGNANWFCDIHYYK